MIDSDRLDELETLIPPPELLGVVRVSCEDLRDLGKLIAVARAAIEWADGRSEDSGRVRALLYEVAHARRP